MPHLRQSAALHTRPSEHEGVALFLMVTQQGLSASRPHLKGLTNHAFAGAAASASVAAASAAARLHCFTIAGGLGS